MIKYEFSQPELVEGKMVRTVFFAIKGPGQSRAGVIEITPGAEQPIKVKLFFAQDNAAVWTGHESKELMGKVNEAAKLYWGVT